MMNYLRRLVKFLLYVIVLVAIIIYVIPVITGKEPTSFTGIFKDSQHKLIWIFFIAYTFIYPLIGFTKVQRHLNGTYNQNRDVFVKAFEMLDFTVSRETEDIVVYRRKSKLARFMQMYEDEIEVKTGDNPVIISGMRKTVKRIDRMLDQLLIKESDQN
ncbi:MAG: hypothetical protein R6X09_05050 [Bacteroidales bacterium]